MDANVSEPAIARETPMPRPPTVRRGILVVASYFLLQMVVSTASGVVLGVAWVATGGNPADKAGLHGFIHAWSPIVTLASLVISAALVFYWLYRKIASMDDGFSFAFIRLVPIAARDLAVAIAIGVAIGLLYLIVTAMFGPRKLPSTLGPISTLSTEKGLAFYTWISLGLLAPFIEEVLFRGVLLQSCLASWPRPPASIVAAATTALAFVAVHLAEIVHVPIAIVGIGGLAIGTTVYAMKRTVSGSIGIHFAYNLVIILSVIAARSGGGNGLVH